MRFNTHHCDIIFITNSMCLKHASFLISCAPCPRNSLQIRFIPLSAAGRTVLMLRNEAAACSALNQLNRLLPAAVAAPIFPLAHQMRTVGASISCRCCFQRRQEQNNNGEQWKDKADQTPERNTSSFYCSDKTPGYCSDQLKNIQSCHRSIILLQKFCQSMIKERGC